ncbi:MAG TPA: aminomethyl-transferring glycine dehydrogenase subunit GcvPA [Abditibacteriaceae bacterium]|nr:aminomethyl-transferring glycine dehydrogenase subunit GcvPA [Abditibacteriaceae bacterium]
MSYVALTDHDRTEMLRLIGVASVDDLFADIPADLRAGAHLNLGEPLPEMAVRRRLQGLAARNHNLEECASFLGAGSYDHYIPAVVPALTGRGEFSTAYTPYQAETSQGTLQVIYEFQTLLCQLTGMEMANASLYDGATALAEAIIMATTITRRNRVLVPRALSPFYRAVARTYTQGLPITLEEIPYENGVTEMARLDEMIGDDVAAVVVQQPNFFGCLEDARALSEAAHARGALLVSVFNPITLGLLSPPGDYEADIAVGEGQSLGIAPQFGGPYVGIFCCRQKYVRFAPGRLVGSTTDEQGRAGFTLTLQTREQHIRREKATSNICTNQALCALAATVYLSALGPQGLRDCAEQSYHKAHYAAQQLADVAGCELAFASPFFHEFALRLPRPIGEVNQRLLEYSIIGGYDLGRQYSELENVMLLCCTEKRTREEMDVLKECLA